MSLSNERWGVGPLTDVPFIAVTAAAEGEITPISTQNTPWESRSPADQTPYKGARTPELCRVKRVNHFPRCLTGSERALGDPSVPQNMLV